jgi:hypothetical protein
MVKQFGYPDTGLQADGWPARPGRRRGRWRPARSPPSCTRRARRPRGSEVQMGAAGRGVHAEHARRIRLAAVTTERGERVRANRLRDDHHQPRPGLGWGNAPTDRRGTAGGDRDSGYKAAASRSASSAVLSMSHATSPSSCTCAAEVTAQDAARGLVTPGDEVAEDVILLGLGVADLGGDGFDGVGRAP